MSAAEDIRCEERIECDYECCKALWSAVMRQAVSDWEHLCSGRYLVGETKHKRFRKEIWADLNRFFFGDCADFDDICTTLGLSKSAIRRRMREIEEMQ